MKSKWPLLLFYCIISTACSRTNDDLNIDKIDEEIPIETIDPGDTTNDVSQKNIEILSLGDSYTIGQSVCETCKFPEQLKTSLITNLGSNYKFNLQVIAQTGWTTTNLKNGINTQSPNENKDLVTLLIGVNNQYQNKPFSIYEQEFPELVQIAKRLAKGNINNIIVISIPDYAFTPFGGGRTSISQDIDKYNAFAKNYCESNNITFINITDITRMGLVNTELVASDGLHPSQLAYTRFVERILPSALEKIN
jgi:acyl-CoA thioesterase-1